MNTTHLDFLMRIAKAIALEPNARATIGIIYKDYKKQQNDGITISDDNYDISYEKMEEIEETITEIFKEYMWQECGLNSTWCVQAWHYGFDEPNYYDGDVYVVDQEDGTYDVVRRYLQREEDECKSVEGGFKSKEEAMRFVEEKLA